MKDSNNYSSLLDRNIPWLGMGIAETNSNKNLNNSFSLEESIRYAIKRGLKVFDVAPNYHEGRAESSLGKELSSLQNNKEIIIFTKVGQLTQTEITDKNHWCFLPEYIDFSVKRSISRLGNLTPDCVFLHNPEDGLSNSYNFLENFSSAIDSLEKLSELNFIKGWGISSWSGFFFNNKPPKLILTEILDYMKSNYPRHHLSAIQFPLGKWNLQSFLKNHSDKKIHFDGKSFVETALSNKLSVVFNSPFYGGDKVPTKEKENGLSAAQQELLLLSKFFPQTIRIVGMGNKNTINEAAELLLIKGQRNAI